MACTRTCLKHGGRVLVLVELQVLPNEFVDDHVLVAECWAWLAGVIECIEDLCPYPGLHLVQHTAVL